MTRRHRTTRAFRVLFAVYGVAWAVGLTLLCAHLWEYGSRWA